MLDNEACGRVGNPPALAREWFVHGLWEWQSDGDGKTNADYAGKCELTLSTWCDVWCSRQQRIFEIRQGMFECIAARGKQSPPYG